jgi:uncharacterized protein (DUF111 family)
MKVDSIGYGAGEKDMLHPNLLRVLIGEISTPSSYWERDSMIQVETHLDDMIPEDFPAAMERILAAGAMDVVITPVVFKKGRSGHALTVLCAPDLLRKVGDVIFKHTSAIGLRHFPVDRFKLPRNDESVSTPLGLVSGKKVERSAGVFTFKPDYNACYQLATNLGVSVQSVRLAAEIAWNSSKEISSE